MILSSGIIRLKNKAETVNNECLTLVLNSVLVQDQVDRDVSGAVIMHWRLAQIEQNVS